MADPRTDAPVRRPRSTPRDNYTGAVCVTRCGFKMIDCESLLELHYAVQRDAFDFRLREMRSQPLKVRYFDGKWRDWTPDFLIRSGSARRRELVEVKSWSFLYPEDEHVRAWRHAKLRAIAEAVSSSSRGEKAGERMTFKFVLCTDREIRVQPRQHNADLLTGAVSPREPPDVAVAELALLSLPPRSDVCQLQRALGPKHDAFGLALWLAWRGSIRLDPSVRWSRETAFQRTENPLS